MFDLHPVARGLILGGIGLIALGVIAQIALRGLRRLPGDIVIQRDNFTLYIPLGAMIVLSLVLTVLLNLLGRWLNGGR